MLPRLLEVRASAGTIERHFALFATTLRADASVDSGTKALLFSLFADGATHEYQSSKFIITRRNRFSSACSHACEGWRKPRKPNASEVTNAKKGVICGLLRFLNEKNRIKCGWNAVFPQE
jgi:hypothetical protein